MGVKIRPLWSTRPPCSVGDVDCVSNILWPPPLVLTPMAGPRGYPYQSAPQRPCWRAESSGPPELRGQCRAALEFFLQLTGAQVLAHVFEFLNVEAQGALDVVAIGGQNVAPYLVRSPGETRHILQPGPGGIQARRPAQLIGNGGRGRPGSEGA